MKFKLVIFSIFSGLSFYSAKTMYRNDGQSPVARVFSGDFRDERQYQVQRQPQASEVTEDDLQVAMNMINNNPLAALPKLGLSNPQKFVLLQSCIGLISPEAAKQFQLRQNLASELKKNLGHLNDDICFQTFADTFEIGGIIASLTQSFERRLDENQKRDTLTQYYIVMQAYTLVGASMPDIENTRVRRELELLISENPSLANDCFRKATERLLKKVNSFHIEDRQKSDALIDRAVNEFSQQTVNRLTLCQAQSEIQQPPRRIKSTAPHSSVEKIDEQGQGGLVVHNPSLQTEIVQPPAVIELATAKAIKKVAQSERKQQIIQYTVLAGAAALGGAYALTDGYFVVSAKAKIEAKIANLVGQLWANAQTHSKDNQKAKLTNNPANLICEFWPSDKDELKKALEKFCAKNTATISTQASNAAIVDPSQFIKFKTTTIDQIQTEVVKLVHLQRKASKRYKIAGACGVATALTIGWWAYNSFFS